MVGVQGLEPWASCSQSRRATNCATPRYEVRQSGWAYSPKASALPTALIPAIQRSIKNLAAHYFYSTEIWWKVKRKLPEMILMMKIMNAAKVNADTTIAKPSSM